MSDLVLQDLQDWIAHRDRAAFRRAYENLQREASVVVRRLEPWLSPDERKQRAQEVVHALLFPSGTTTESAAATKLLPLLSAESAAPGYRAKVFYSFIIDEHRAKIRHQELDQGFADPMTAAAIREARRKRRERQTVVETARPKSNSPLSTIPAASTRMQLEEDVVDRIAIRRALVRMSNVRHQAIVALEFSFDLTPFLDELAQRLGRDASTLAVELEGLKPGDESALVRVFHPLPEPLSKARENFGRARRRALQELRSVLNEERRS